ncbi:MAG TPA: hypothetical protein VEJ43_06400, partial [Pseudolabrys sp.]|nr:hypothetical protein [Pseudolabrys sp.]
LICASAIATSSLIFFAIIGALGAVHAVASCHASLIKQKVNIGTATMAAAPAIKTGAIWFFTETIRLFTGRLPENFLAGFCRTF